MSEAARTEIETENKTEVNPEIKNINNTELTVKVYQNQRVVTFKDIDAVHERVEGTARKRFNDNKKHFIEGEDYYIVTPQTLKNIEMSEKRTLENDIKSNRGTVLITESGYLMLVKSFTDDLAWDVQRQLVKNYFRANNKNTDNIGNITGKDNTYGTDNFTDNLTNTPNALNFHNAPVITTSELSKHYGISCQNVLTAFYRHKEHFDKNIHYFLLEMDEEIEFRKMNGLNMATKLYLWTRKGSLMFTKIINNDIGWNQYKRILDILFLRAYGDEKKVRDGAMGTENMHQPLMTICDKQLKPQNNWYLKNLYKIERICNALDINKKEFNHLILTKIQGKYDMEHIGAAYKGKNGKPPEYALDIIGYFPELLEITDDMLLEYMLSVVDKYSLLKGVAIK